MSKFNLFNKNWKQYKMDDLFVFHKGKRILKEDMVPGNTNFIAAIDDNNGIRQKIYLLPTHNRNCITVNYNGSVGEAFYQDKPFRASDDVNILYPKGWVLNQNIGLFLATIIRSNKYRFGYGRKWNLEKMKETFIALPTKGDAPDWDFMDSYINNLTDFSKITTKIKHKELPFDTTKWKKFEIRELFELDKGTELINGHEAGAIPLVSASASNNGIAAYICFGKKLFEGNQLSVSTNGSIGEVFYQPKPFYATSDICVLTSTNKLNKYIACFLVTLIAGEKFKYSYGRKFNLSRIRSTSIKLPTDTKGNPDWEYMENYIKSLPYADLI